MTLDISLFCNNLSHRGPGMVAQNLIKGLDKLGHSVKAYESIGTISSNGLFGCLQPVSGIANLPTKTLMGPNLFVLPSHAKELVDGFENFVVPSQWVNDKYKSFETMKNKSVFNWSVGIDTDLWDISGMVRSPKTCFIYYKNRAEQDLKYVIALCKKLDIRYQIIQYGGYQEKDLLRACSISDFAILLTGTESQGIGYMQILSTNTPCYVFEVEKWKDEQCGYEFSATSVPYWSEACGAKTTKLNFEHLKSFTEDVKQGKFSPREYILKEHTLEHGAQRYVDILLKTQG